jgi:hypothetical protein
MPFIIKKIPSPQYRKLQAFVRLYVYYKLDNDHSDVRRQRLTQASFQQRSHQHRWPAPPATLVNIVRIRLAAALITDVFLAN